MKVSFYSLFLFFILWLPACHNETRLKTIGSLTELPELLDSISKLDSLVNANKVLDHKKAHRYALNALALATRMNSPSALAKAYLILGISYFNFQNDSCFQALLKAQQITDKNKLSAIKPRLFYLLAMIYKAANDSKMYTLCLDSSILIAQKVDQYSLVSDAYNALGNLKLTLKDSINAKIMIDSAYSIAARHRLSKRMGIALAGLARFTNNPHESGKMQKTAIKLLEKVPGNEEEIASINCNLGLNSSDPDTALSYYLIALQMAKTGNAAELQIATLNNMAYSYMDKKDLEKAETCLASQAVPLATRIESYDWLSTLYDSYTDLLILEKKTDKALIYARKALSARVESDRREGASQVLLLTSVLDLKNKELKIQTSEREIQTKENKIQKVTLWFSISLLGILLILFTALWKMQRNKFKFKTEQLASAKKLIEIEESMKGRLSMEIHDIVSPFYLTIKQQIEQARIQNSQIEKGLQDNLKKMTSGIREISHRMNNKFIEQLTISELVAGLSDDMNQRSSVPIQCSIQIRNFKFTPEENVHIYRIIQELLMNAVKYVRFGEISLTLSEEYEAFYIIYKDTGPGFNIREQENKGLGISNIRERSRIIGAKADLTALPGMGSKWVISIPYKRDKYEIKT